MAFILIEHSQEPLKVRERMVVPSTISILDSPVKGEYIGVKSKQKISLINHGGFMKVAADVREAYHLSNIIPATFRKRSGFS